MGVFYNTNTIQIYNTNTLYLHLYMHDILPTGDNLMKYGIILSLPKCGLCKQGNFTVKHLFIQCGYFHLSRKNLLNELKETDNNIKWDETLFRYFHNERSTNNLVDLKIIEKMCEYIYNVWMVYKQNKEKLCYCQIFKNIYFIYLNMQGWH